MRKQKINQLIFSALNKLQATVFIIYIKRDYIAKRHFYEKKLYHLRVDLMRAMKKARVDFSVQNIYLLERMYEILLSLNNLKLRVRDHASFEVSEHEFKNLTLSLSAIFQALCHSDSAELQEFSLAIDTFKEVTQNALQVIAYDPLVYVFFLQDLQSLQSSLQEYNASAGV